MKRVLLICLAAAFTLCAQNPIPKAIPRSSAQRAGDMLSIKDFGARGDTQITYGIFNSDGFNTTAGSAALSYTSGCGVACTGVLGSFPAGSTTITFYTPPTLNYSGYMMLNYPTSNATYELVRCIQLVVNTCTLAAPTQFAHVTNDSELPPVFLPTDAGKTAFVGGAGPSSTNLWVIQQNTGGIYSTGTTPIVAGSVSAQGAQTTNGYIQITASVLNNPVVWSVWGSNSITFASETSLYSATIQPFNGSAANSWNNRDGYKIINPTYSFYRFKVADVTAGSHGQLLYASVAYGNVLPTTIQSFTDPYNITLANTATSTTAFTSMVWGTDDTVAIANALSSVGKASPNNFGVSNFLWIPSGSYLTTLPVAVSGNNAINITGAGINQSHIILSPNATSAIASDGTGYSYNLGLLGLQYGTQLNGWSWDCSGVYADACVYSSNPQEDNAMEHFGGGDFNGHYGIFINYGQNWMSRSVTSTGSYHNFPQPMMYLTQNVTAPVGQSPTSVSNANPVVMAFTTLTGVASGDTVLVTGCTGNTTANGYQPVTVSGTNVTFPGVAGNGTYTGGCVLYSAQTVTVNSTAPFAATPGLMDIGWLTKTRERAVSAIIVDSTHLRIPFAQNHSNTDAILHNNMPVSIRVNGYGNSSLFESTTFPGPEFGTAEGIGVQAGGLTGHGIHSEAAIAAWDTEGSLSPVDTVTGNINTATVVAAYSATDACHISPNGSPLAFFDGVSGFQNAAYLDFCEHTNYYGTGDNYHGAGYTNFYDKTLINSLGVYPQWLLFGQPSPPTFFPYGPMGIGGYYNAQQFRITQDCGSNSIISIMANNGTGTAGVPNSGTWPSACSGAGPGSLAAIQFDINNNTFISSLAFGTPSGVVDGNAHTYYSMDFGSPIHSPTNYVFRWSQSGTNQTDLRLQQASTYGSVYYDVLHVDAAQGIVNFDRVASVDWVTSGAPHMSKASGPYHYSVEMTQSDLAAFMGLSATCAVVNWNAPVYGCTALPLSPTATNQPLYWTSSSAWGYYTSASLQTFLGGGTALTAGQPLNIDVTSGYMIGMTPAAAANYIHTGTAAVSGDAVIYSGSGASAVLTDAGYVPARVLGATTSGHSAVFNGTANSVSDSGSAPISAPTVSSQPLEYVSGAWQGFSATAMAQYIAGTSGYTGTVLIPSIVAGSGLTVSNGIITGRTAPSSGVTGSTCTAWTNGLCSHL